MYVPVDVLAAVVVGVLLVAAGALLQIRSLRRQVAAHRALVDRPVRPPSADVPAVAHADHVWEDEPFATRGSFRRHRCTVPGCPAILDRAGGG